MAASWILVKAFLREATEGADYAPVSDIATVYAKLRAVQRGHYTSAISAGDGTTQISSRIGETEFHFAIPAELDAAGIIEIAETALEVIEGKTVAQVRAMLTRRKTTRPDFRTYRLA